MTSKVSLLHGRVFLLLCLLLTNLFALSSPAGAQNDPTLFSGQATLAKATS